MTALETLIIIGCVIALILLVGAVLLGVLPLTKMQKLQRCQDACVAAYGIGNSSHQACVSTCLAEYHSGGE